MPDAPTAVAVIEETLRRLDPQAAGIIHIAPRVAEALAEALEEAGMLRRA